MPWYKRTPDERQPNVTHSFSQDGPAWRLEVRLYEPTTGFDGPSWQSRINFTYVWAYVPNKNEIDAKVIELTMDCWEAYDIYLYANGRKPRAAE